MSGQAPKKQAVITCHRPSIIKELALLFMLKMCTLPEWRMVFYFFKCLPSLLYTFLSIMTWPCLFLPHTLHIILRDAHHGAEPCHTLPPHPPTHSTYLKVPKLRRRHMMPSSQIWLIHPVACPVQLTDWLHECDLSFLITSSFRLSFSSSYEVLHRNMS